MVVTMNNAGAGVCSKLRAAGVALASGGISYQAAVEENPRGASCAG